MLGKEQRRETERGGTEGGEKEEKDEGKARERQERQGVIVKGEESANMCELEIEMVKQKLCLQRVCVRREGDSGLTQA